MSVAASVFQPILTLLAAQTAAGAKALWPSGPTVARKSGGTVPLDDYLRALTALEDAYVSATPGELYQRLRRLYYSAPLGGAGGKFDRALGTNEFLRGQPGSPGGSGDDSRRSAPPRHAQCAFRRQRGHHTERCSTRPEPLVRAARS